MNKHNPLVSIVIPCYNSAHYVAQTLESILAQSYKNWECIIINDGSTDNLDDVLQNYLHDYTQIRCFKIQNAGLANARNTGILKSEGEYIQFIDADDLIEPQKIESQVLYLNANPHIAMVCTEVYSFVDGEDVKVLNPLFAYAGEYLTLNQKQTNISNELYYNIENSNFLSYILQNNFTSPHSPLLRKNLVDSVGLFDKTPRGCEDWHYWLRCVFFGANIAFLNQQNTKALYRFSPLSMSKNMVVMQEGHLRVKEWLNETLKDGELKAKNYEQLLTARFDWAKSLILSNQKNRGRALLLDTLKKYDYKRNYKRKIRHFMLYILSSILPLSILKIL